MSTSHLGAHSRDRETRGAECSDYRASALNLLGLPFAHHCTYSDYSEMLKMVFVRKKKSVSRVRKNKAVCSSIGGILFTPLSISVDKIES